MNLRSVDLNLLVALDALLGDRHVTRAARRVGISQPAMSNALARLRHTFGDELLVRTPSGMQPTARAMELVEPVRQLLRQVERVFESDASFDAARSQRAFTLRMSDVLGYLLLPQLCAACTREAPGVSLDVKHYSPAHTLEALEKDELDVALSMSLDHGASIGAMAVLSDRMVCVMGAANPLAGSALTLDAFLARRHVRISMSPTDLRFVDDVLAREHREREIAINVPHWLVVPHVLAGSDLLAVMPARLAAALPDAGMVVRELPFASEAFQWTLYWHRRHDANPALDWLRAQVVRVCAQVERRAN